MKTFQYKNIDKRNFVFSKRQVLSYVLSSTFLLSTAYTYVFAPLILLLGAKSSGVLRFVCVVIIVLSLHLLHGVFEGNQIKVMPSEILMLLGVPCCIALGYRASKTPEILERTLKLLVMFSYISILIYAVRYISVGAYNFDDRYLVRSIVGRGPFLPGVGLIAALLLTKYYRDSINAPISLFLTFISFLASILLSESRAMFALTSIGVIVALFPRLTQLYGWLLVLVVMANLTLFAPFISEQTKREIFEREGIFQAQLSELYFDDRNYSLMNIQNNWRGFEIYSLARYMKSESNLDLLIGGGLGATLPISEYVNLDGEYYNALPRFHNFNIYLLIKFGVVGFAFFYMALTGMIFRLILRKPKPSAYLSIFTYAILVWTFTIPVLQGPLTTQSPGAITAFLFGLGWRALKETHENPDPLFADRIQSKMGSDLGSQGNIFR